MHLNTSILAIISFISGFYTFGVHLKYHDESLHQTKRDRDRHYWKYLFISTINPTLSIIATSIIAPDHMLNTFIFSIYIGQFLFFSGHALKNPFGFWLKGFSISIILVVPIIAMIASIYEVYKTAS